jgi:hypothetical protein
MIAAAIMDGAFSDEYGSHHTGSPVWEHCGDGELRPRAADLLLRSMKEAKARGNDAGRYANKLTYAYQTVLGHKLGGPERYAAWYAESVEHYAGKDWYGSEQRRALFWMLDFEPTRTYAAGKKILDGFNARYRKNKIYYEYPAYRGAYYYLYARSKDKRYLEDMLAAVCGSHPELERHRIFFEAEISFILGEYEQGLARFARYMAEHHYRDDIFYFINNSGTTFPDYPEERALSYRIWNQMDRITEEKTESLSDLLRDFWWTLERRCFSEDRKRTYANGPLSEEEAACARKLITLMDVHPR